MTLHRFLERLIWLCMLPLIILGMLLLLLHLHTLNERRQMLADSVVRAAARSLDQMLEVRLASLQLLGRMLDEGLAMQAGRLDPERAHRIAQQYVELFGHHVAISTDEYQMVLNTRVPSGQALPTLPRIEGYSAMASVIASRTPAVGDMFMGPVVEKPMVALAVPLHVDSRQLFLLISSIETEYLQQRVENFKLPAGWLLRVEDSRGQEMARSAPDSNIPMQPPLHQASLAGAPWTVRLMAPAISPLDNTTLQGLLLLGTLASTVAVAYLGGHIAAKRLTRAMDSLTLTEPRPTPMRDIDEVAQVRQALRRLARRREALREAERRRIGRELHDELQQKLALLRFDVDGLRQAVVPPDRPAPAACLERLDRVEKLLDETMEGTRRLVQDLRPPILQEFGLPPALRSLAESHRLAHGQKVDVQVRGPDQWTALPEETATALYRVAQEALNNIRKHSKARTVDMVVEIKPSGHVLMEVSDDGDGFDVEGAGALTNGNGLRGMQERIQSLSGTLRIMSKPGAGTAVLVEVPPSAEEAPGSRPGVQPL